MSFSTEEIVVMINSNIPDKPAFKLTSSMLYHPDLKYGKKLSLVETPFFTADVEYPYKSLWYLSKQSYKKILQFFFNKSYFEKKLMAFLPNEKRGNNTRGNSGMTDEEKERDSLDTRNIIMKRNVMIMLALLFPTTFPAKGNLSDSYHSFILHKSDKSTSVKTSSVSSNFSYIKEGGKTYTVSKVVWINDFFNHPEYRSFIDEFHKYKRWSENESKEIKKRVTSLKEILLKKLKRNDTDTKNDKDILYLPIFIKDIKENIKEYYENGELNTKKIDAMKFLPSERNRLQFFYDVSGLIDLLEKLGTYTNEPDSIEIDILYSKIKDIKETIERINKSGTTLRGVSTVFYNRLSKLSESIKSLEVLEKIKANYMSSGAVNIQLEGEDPEVVKELTGKYERYTNFVAKIKDLLPPKRESSNYKLQNAINNYSKGQADDDVGGDKNFKFQKIIEAVSNELIFLKSKQFFSKESNMEYLDVGVSGIDKNKINVPHFEIYVALDLIEGEINESNVRDIKCKWRGLYLGQETEGFFSRNNKYDINNHRVFVPEKEIMADEDIKYTIEKENEGKENADAPPPPPPEKKGGRKTRKNKRSKLRLTYRNT